ncbi:MAG: glycosyltransferase family 4 protein [Spirochaetales bacterium]|nr:glycosyltransferase family 4 protein [Spirochaetales bacterium]MCF7938046.1 glycosyltransferase family 4 protein [Spirochaetales bacterium]
MTRGRIILAVPAKSSSPLSGGAVYNQRLLSGLKETDWEGEELAAEPAEFAQKVRDRLLEIRTGDSGDTAAAQVLGSAGAQGASAGSFDKSAGDKAAVSAEFGGKGAAEAGPFQSDRMQTILVLDSLALSVCKPSSRKKIFSAARELGVPLLLLLHYLPSLAGEGLRQNEQAWFSGAEGCITVSCFLEEELCRRGFEKDLIRVCRPLVEIPGGKAFAGTGVDSNIPAPEAGVPESGALEEGAPETGAPETGAAFSPVSGGGLPAGAAGPVRFLLPANWHPNKNILFLVRIFLSLNLNTGEGSSVPLSTVSAGPKPSPGPSGKEEQPWILELAGDRSFDKDYTALVEKEISSSPFGRRIRILGSLSPAELFQKYREADLVIMPSRFESYGMVAAEALSVGTPVAVSRVGGVPEAAKEGWGAVLLPPGDRPVWRSFLQLYLLDDAWRAKLAAEAADSAAAQAQNAGGMGGYSRAAEKMGWCFAKAVEELTRTPCPSRKPENK